MEIINKNLEGEWAPFIEDDYVDMLFIDGSIAFEGRTRNTRMYTFAEWYKRVLSVELKSTLSGKRYPLFVEAHKELIEQVFAGHSIEFDGTRMVGTLTRDAQDALYELQQLADDMEPDIYTWEVGEWFSNEKTVEDVETLIAEARRENVHLNRTELVRYLRDD